MTDRPFDAATVHADEELVFDDEADPAPPPPPRKAPRKGRTTAVPETVSAAVPEPAAEEPAGAPAPIPPRDEPPAGSDPKHRERVPAMLLAIVAFAFLTSLVALGATIAIARTLAAAHADRERAAADAREMARVPAMVRALDAATARLDRAAPAPAGPPATADDVRAAIDDLRAALARRRLDGAAPVAGTLRDGFSEIGTRLTRIEDRLAARSR